MNHLQFCFLKMIHNTSYKDCPSGKRIELLRTNHRTLIIRCCAHMEQVREDHGASTLSRNSLLYNLILSLALKENKVFCVLLRGKQL